MPMALPCVVHIVPCHDLQCVLQPTTSMSRVAGHGDSPRMVRRVCCFVAGRHSTSDHLRVSSPLPRVTVLCISLPKKVGCHVQFCVELLLAPAAWVLIADWVSVGITTKCAFASCALRLSPCWHGLDLTWPLVHPQAV